MATTKEPIQIYEGIITYNTVNLVKNGTKKIFNGFFRTTDGSGNQVSYKIISFRSQIIMQSEALGEKGMANKKAKIHGIFKQSTYNQAWELWAEEMWIEGYEALAEQAKAKSLATSMPTPPPGVLPNFQNLNQPMPIQQTQAPVYDMPAPPPLVGPNNFIQQPIPQMQQPVAGPAPIAGGYVYNG